MNVSGFEMHKPFTDCVRCADFSISHVNEEKKHAHTDWNISKARNV